MVKIIAMIVVPAAVFVVWRWTSVKRGTQQRDEKLIARLDPIGKKIDAGETISMEEIEALAARPENRHILFAALSSPIQRGPGHSPGQVMLRAR